MPGGEAISTILLYTFTILVVKFIGLQYYFFKPIVYLVCKIVELSNKCSGVIITMFFFELW